MDCLFDLAKKGEKKALHLGPFQVWFVSYIGRNPNCSGLKVIILTPQIERILPFFRGCCQRMGLSKTLLSVGACRFGLGIVIVERIVDTVRHSKRAFQSLKRTLFLSLNSLGLRH